MDLIYAKKFINDDREPFFSLQHSGYQVDILVPDILFFIQMVLIGFYQVFLTALLGVILYYGVVEGWKKKKKRGTPTSLRGKILGYGVVIPLALYIPVYFCNQLDIRNRAMRLALLALPVTMIFGTMEDMYGFTHEKAASSLRDYLIYVALMFRPKYQTIKEEKDDTENEDAKQQHEKQQQEKNPPVVFKTKYVRATEKSVLQSIKRAILYNFLLSFSFTVFSQRDYFPFETARPHNEVLISLAIGQLYNTFIQANLLSFSLGFASSMLSILFQVIFGKQLNDEICRFPLFLSSSVSDFWGYRWNNIIHYNIKQGVYKPVRWNTGSRYIAGFAAFLASGLIHEYCAYFIYSANEAEQIDLDAQPGNIKIAPYVFGKMTLFFVWNGLLIVMEYALGHHFVAHSKKILPWWIQNHLVIMMALPMGHLFTGDWTESGFFHHLQSSCFRLKIHPIETA